MRITEEDIRAWAAGRLADPPPKRGPYPHRSIEALTGLLRGRFEGPSDAARAMNTDPSLIVKALDRARLTSVRIYVPRADARRWRDKLQAQVLEQLIGEDALS